MKRGRLLFVLWCSSILTGGIRAITCFSDYIHNITCVLDSDSPKFNSYTLMFNGSSEFVSCPLVMMNHSYHCTCRVKTELISFLDRYIISLCNESDCHVEMKDFDPRWNIQLTQPPVFDIQHTRQSVNITWKTEIYRGNYLEDELIYEFKLQDSQGSQGYEKILSSQNVKYILFKESAFKPETEYCATARYMPDPQLGYEGKWSKWSKPICWINEAGEEERNISVILAKYLSPVCLIIVVLLLVFYNPTARMKIKTIIHTPSPAPFFQPLFQQHEGNLQEWLSPRGKFALMHKAEEDLITSAVTVVPKPIIKDPEENQGFNNPPVPHLVFPQNLTSYVGLPVMQEVSPPINLVCADNTPYTQLPCPFWGFDHSEKQATSPPPEHFLEISKTDSGCSCEDLSQSPEFSLPSSPVDESPLPHFCTDYCILNKTAEGIVPVLISKQSSGKILSDSQQADG
ncbi:interleukin-21 receptor-like isoform X1 [Melanotaenia boesemani]|uniref:interleukin-21 receptor-like isoform X1 n=1 Tax=Melanotaenia boesemani TaxID=1250792 RepID=UPI001C0529D5|nr:interleukin-21 receptor-like isoform X1 [Melanotaenia boesemani]